MSRFKRKSQPVETQTNETEVPTNQSDEEIITETVVEETQVEVTPNNFTVAAEKLEAVGIEPIALVEPATTNKRGVIPDQFGNNVKGERICKNCGIKESETLAKNPRYSFCKGLCVNCYGKLERKTVKPDAMTVEQIQAKITYYTDLLNKKIGEPGRVEESTILNDSTTIDNESVVTHGASVDDLEVAKVSQ